MLVDGELPGEQLQDRLRTLVGRTHGRLRLITPEFMPEGVKFPRLSLLADQELMKAELEQFKPDVVILDTLTRCFRFDTNDPDSWDTVNDFLLDLRYAGYCVIILHHAGKNGSQRGLTQGDNNLDVSIKLARPPMYESEDGCKFVWTWEKVRHANSLAEFTGGYDKATKEWYFDDEVERSVVELTLEGKSQHEIAAELGIDRNKVQRIRNKKGVRSGVSQK
jgi:hypothetical protein